MSGKIKFELNNKGVIALFKSPEVNAWLQGVGDDVANIASNMYGGENVEYGARAHNADRTAVVNVFPASKEAAHDNYEHNTLEKALGVSGLPRSKPRIKI